LKDLALRWLTFKDGVALTALDERLMSRSRLREVEDDRRRSEESWPRLVYMRE
jgi:hypothetical protein